MPRKQGDPPDHEESREEMKRFSELLPPEGDLELLVLKGHLLIEEGLRALVSREIRYPKALEETHFNFFKILHVAKGLCYAEDMAWLWDMLERLNQLRNQMAHKLDAEAFRSRLVHFLEPISKSSSIKDPEDLDGRLREALYMLHLMMRTYSNAQFDHGKSPNFHE
ncbi:MAG: hypothetical protein O7B29_15515 [Deltaproteobacteria bacterium]|nr:hypothetical protein [Deltaproteobacteria bacterium]